MTKKIINEILHKSILYLPIQNLENITLSISSVEICPVIFPTYVDALRKDCAAISILSSNLDNSRYILILSSV